MSDSRAVRYRRLALAEEDKQKADLLLQACGRGGSGRPLYRGLDIGRFQ